MLFGVNATLGSISSATHRLEDLIPAYLGALSDLVDEVRLAKADGAVLLAKTAWIGGVDERMGEIEKKVEKAGEDDASEPGYFESEDATYDLEWLTETLEEFAPFGAGFGSHEGDGADFGFWVSSEFLGELHRAMEEDGGKVVSDLGEIDADGEKPKHVAQVNERGNVEMYELDDNGNYKSIWSLV